MLIKNVDLLGLIASVQCHNPGSIFRDSGGRFGTKYDSYDNDHKDDGAEEKEKTPVKPKMSAVASHTPLLEGKKSLNHGDHRGLGGLGGLEPTPTSIALPTDVCRYAFYALLLCFPVIKLLVSRVGSLRAQWSW
jgi:hypothetical protein